MPPLKFRLPTSKILTLLGFLIVAYTLFSLSRLFWKSYRLSSEIKSLEGDITQLEERKKELQNLTTYFRSSSYKEKEARRRLGYQRPGEHVLIIVSEEKPTEEVEEEERPSKPNWQLWWEYFF